MEGLKELPDGRTLSQCGPDAANFFGTLRVPYGPLRCQDSGQNTDSPFLLFSTTKMLVCLTSLLVLATMTSVPLQGMIFTPDSGFIVDHHTPYNSQLHDAQGPFPKMDA